MTTALLCAKAYLEVTCYLKCLNSVSGGKQQQQQNTFSIRNCLKK